MLRHNKKLEKEAEKILDNIMKAVEQGVINKTTSKRMNELEEQLNELEQKIIIEKKKVSNMIPREGLKEYFTKAIKMKAEMVINYLL